MLETNRSQHVTLKFGMHKDEPITRVPVSYLKWMVCVGSEQCEDAAAELKRRGTRTPDLDVSGHAIDRASLKCRRTWHETKQEDEGLHSWLCRVSREAIMKQHYDKEGRYRHIGLLFVFETSGKWPVLKTIMPEKEGKQ